jgi:hypothetical protein
MKWSPQNLVAVGIERQAAIECLVVAHERGEKVSVHIERMDADLFLGRPSTAAASRAQLREACIKAAESAVWLFPLRACVLAEIHRRFDQVPEKDRATAEWRSGVAAIYDFAGAWSLAAQLMKEGLTVSVVEEDRTSARCRHRDRSGADVDIVIPVDPGQGEQLGLRGFPKAIDGAHETVRQFRFDLPQRRHEGAQLRPPAYGEQTKEAIDSPRRHGLHIGILQYLCEFKPDSLDKR